MTLSEQLNGNLSSASFLDEIILLWIVFQSFYYMYVQETFRTVSFQQRSLFNTHIWFFSVFCNCSKMLCRPEVAHLMHRQVHLKGRVWHFGGRCLFSDSQETENKMIYWHVRLLIKNSALIVLQPIWVWIQCKKISQIPSGEQLQPLLS